MTPQRLKPLGRFYMWTYLWKVCGVDCGESLVTARKWGRGVPQVAVPGEVRDVAGGARTGAEAWGGGGAEVLRS